MKVLHGMTEVAGQGIHSVNGLKQNGAEAQMAVWRRNSFGYSVDYDLKIGHNYLLYPFYFLKMTAFFLFALRRFDCFHFHYGRSLLPGCLDLKILRALKKKVYMEFHGSDIRGSFERSGYKYLELPPTSTRRKSAIRRIVNNVDGIILHDEELRRHLPVSETPVYIVPLRMNVDNFAPAYPDENKRIPTIVHAPSKRAVKGTEYILKALEAINKPYKLVLVENKTQEEALAIYKTADIIIDQLLIGTYGVYTIESMALGKPVIVYIDEEMKKTFPPELPLVSADINTIQQKIEMLIDKVEQRKQLGIQSRQYVERYHDCRKNAAVLFRIYNGKCPVLTGSEAFLYADSMPDSLDNLKGQTEFEQL